MLDLYIAVKVTVITEKVDAKGCDSNYALYARKSAPPVYLEVLTGVAPTCSTLVNPARSIKFS